MSYMTLSSQEKHPFLLFSYFHAHPTTLLSKYWGGRMHERPPPQTFGGPSPLGFRPWVLSSFESIGSFTVHPVHILCQSVFDRTFIEFNKEIIIMKIIIITIIIIK